MEGDSFEIEIESYIIGDLIKMKTALSATLLNGMVNCSALKAMHERAIEEKMLKALLSIKIEEYHQILSLALDHLKNELNFIEYKNDILKMKMNAFEEVSRMNEILKKWEMVYEDRMEKTEYEPFECLERTIIECVGGTPIRPMFSSVAQAIIDTSERKMNSSRNYEKILLEFEDFKMKCLTPSKAESTKKRTPTYPVFDSEVAKRMSDVV